MTTATAVVSNRTMETAVQSRRSLEELVDRVIDALFSEEKEPTERSAARTIHESRRLRLAGDVDGALTALGEVDMAKADANQARWAFAEWKQLVKRRFAGPEILVYSQGTGKAAALAPKGDGTLEVVAVLGMRWKPGKVISGRSLRGLRPLIGGA